MSPGIDSPFRVATGRVGFNENSLSHCRSTRGKASIPPSLDTSTHGAVGGTRVLIASNKMSFYIILCHFGELRKKLIRSSSLCFVTSDPKYLFRLQRNHLWGSLQGASSTGASIICLGKRESAQRPSIGVKTLHSPLLKWCTKCCVSCFHQFSTYFAVCRR